MAINQQTPSTATRCFTVYGRDICNVRLVALNRSMLITNRVKADTLYDVSTIKVQNLQNNVPAKRDGTI